MSRIKELLNKGHITPEQAAAIATLQGEGSFAAPAGSAAYVVEYQAFDAEKRSFGWKELVRYKTRKLADTVVRINKRKCELRVRKLWPQNNRIS